MWCALPVDVVKAESTIALMRELDIWSNEMSTMIWTWDLGVEAEMFSCSEQWANHPPSVQLFSYEFL